MKKIKLLDCTLRDGGYVNDFCFGKNNIINIIKTLNNSNIEIIECGFLDDKINYSIDRTIFKNINQLLSIDNNIFDKKKKYALMVLAETFDANSLPIKNQNSVDIIRLSFHKSDTDKAIKLSREIKKKGYELYLQPTVTKSYSDEEIKILVNICNNEIKPSSLAIVDTFGEMYSSDVMHYTKLFDKNLDSDITLSFHSHNNLQNAFANSINFINNIYSNREAVIDCSIYGMGKGAGNLCSEIIMDYLNKKFKKDYKIEYIVDIIESTIMQINQNNYWGYSLEYYLSAINGCHPNYCNYFVSKKTLTVNDLKKLLKMINMNKKLSFDKEYAEEMYFSYLNSNMDDELSYDRLKNYISRKQVVLLGPGSTYIKYNKKIAKFINNRQDYFVISVNFVGDKNVDAFFFSNRKRYYSSFIKKENLYILTSNVNFDYNKNSLIFNYSSLLSDKFDISDNSLLMAIKMLINSGCTNVYLAGFDGYQIDNKNNFYKDDLSIVIDKNETIKINNLIKKYIKYYSANIKIDFLTPSMYNEKGEIL